MAKPLNTIFFISYTITLLSSLSKCKSDPLANATTTKGFTTDLIHRDSPDSPLSDPSLTPWQRLAQARQRSLARASIFTDRLTQRKSIESTINGVHGTYLIRFSIGTPPHHTIAIMDTGSQLIWTQCEPCEKCMKQLFPVFSPGSSTTYKDERCDSPRCGTFGRASVCDKRREKCVYSVLYGDNSYSSGTVATETFTFAESRGGALHYFNNIQFGCGHDNYFHFASSIPSGIVGLSGGKSSLLSQFGYDSFSYCLTTYEDRKKGSKLHFGEDADVTGRTMVWTPMTEMNVPDLYFVALEAISVGNKRIEYHNPALLEGGNIVMDSGTVLTVLPVNFYDDVEVAIANSIEQRAVRDYKDWRLCYSDPFVMPKITVHLKKADVEWKHENVFIRVSPDYECLALLPKEGLPIYGNVAQANYLVGYDFLEISLSYLSPLSVGCSYKFFA